jgi:hypothetical protein
MHRARHCSRRSFVALLASTPRGLRTDLSTTLVIYGHRDIGDL